MTPATPALVPSANTAVLATLLAFAADLVAAQFTGEPVASRRPALSARW